MSLAFVAPQQTVRSHSASSHSGAATRLALGPAEQQGTRLSEVLGLASIGVAAERRRARRRSQGFPTEIVRRYEPASLEREDTFRVDLQQSELGQSWLPTLLTSATITWVLVSSGVMSQMGSWYVTFARSFPLACAVATTSCKGLASDLMAQLVVEGKGGLDLRRTCAFVSFGTAFLGFFGFFKYNFFYPHMFGSACTASVIAKKVLADMFISAPFLYFPTFYTIKAVFAGKPVSAALSEYFSKQGMVTLLRYWSLWFPAETLMWIAVPSHLRIAYCCSISLCWQIALSTMSYSSKKPLLIDAKR